jgi:YD repeat-containing protein
MRCIRDIRLPGRQCESPDHRHATWLKYFGLGQRTARTVTIEIATEADSFRVIPTKAWMLPIYLLEDVNDSFRSESVRRQPAPRIGKQKADYRKHRTDENEPQNRARLRQLGTSR